MFYLVFRHQKYFTWKNNFLIFLKSAHPIPRKWLFVSIRLGFLEYESIKLFDISGKLYLKTSLTHQESQVTFLVTSGVVQEGPECTCLFNLYTDFVLHVFMNNCTRWLILLIFKTSISNQCEINIQRAIENWEYVTKILSCGGLLLYLGAAIHARQLIHCRELQLFLIKYLPIMVCVSAKQWFLNYMLLGD